MRKGNLGKYSIEELKIISKNLEIFHKKAIMGMFLSWLIMVVIFLILVLSGVE